MTIDQQAQQVLAIWPKTRFSLKIVIELYLIQESFAVAEERICSLSAGKIDEGYILAEIDRYKTSLDSGALLVSNLRNRNLRSAIAYLGDYVKETRFSPVIRQRENALASLKKAMDFIDQIPLKADPVLYTPEVQEYLAERINRLVAFRLKVEGQLVQLRQWDQAEQNAGNFDLVPAFQFGTLPDLSEDELLIQASEEHE